MFCSLLRVTGCDACSRCPSSCATHCLPVFTSCYRLDQSSAFVRTMYICFAPAARACVPLFFLIADSWAHLCSGPAPAIGRVAASELSSPRSEARFSRHRAEALALALAHTPHPPPAFFLRLPCSLPFLLRVVVWRGLAAAVPLPLRLLDRSVPHSLPWIGPRPLLDPPMPALFSIACICSCANLQIFLAYADSGCPSFSPLREATFIQPLLQSPDDGALTLRPCSTD